MRGVNLVIIVGNCGQDPDLRYTKGGKAVANISVATTEVWKSDNEKHERTEWHRIVFFGKLAEIVGQYLYKGSQVYVEGKLTTEKWQDKQGNDRYTTKIIANQLQMLGSKEGGTKPRQEKDFADDERPAPKDDHPVTDDGGFDDIPF